jgi:hypothetical protein
VRDFVAAWNKVMNLDLREGSSRLLRHHRNPLRSHAESSGPLNESGTTERHPRPARPALSRIQLPCLPLALFTRLTEDQPTYFIFSHFCEKLGRIAIDELKAYGAPRFFQDQVR